MQAPNSVASTRLAGNPPANVLDLFTEFRAHTNGTDWLEGRSLLAALQYFNVDGIGAVEKQGMRELILRGGPWSEEQRTAILDYCASDVYALERLLPRMLPEIEVPRALQRGRYMKAAAAMEFAGVPIDADKLKELRDAAEAPPTCPQGGNVCEALALASALVAR
jgi:hypothetical protein